jgi:hypothetical protein
MSVVLASSLLDDGTSQRKGCNVQEYIRTHGKRKCEANGLLRNPRAAQQILRDAVRRYVSDDDLASYQKQRSQDRTQANIAVGKAMAQIGR